MKSCYIFLYAPAGLNSSTVVLSVWAGKSKRDMSALRYLESLTACNDYYIRPRSREVENFVAAIEESIECWDGCFEHRLRQAHIDVVQLARLVRNMQLSDFLSTVPPAVDPLRLATSLGYAADYRAAQPC